MYRHVAEEGRSLTISYSDVDELVLVVTDGTYSKVKFRDFSIMLMLPPAPTKSEPCRCAWGVIHTGYIDANAMHVPRVKRKICYWQLTQAVWTWQFGREPHPKRLLAPPRSRSDFAAVPRSHVSRTTLTTCRTWCTTRWHPASRHARRQLTSSRTLKAKFIMRARTCPVLREDLGRCRLCGQQRCLTSRHGVK